MSTCVKPYVTCVVCSVRRVHDAGCGRAEHTTRVADGQSTCTRVENPSDSEVCFFLCAGDVMAARVVGIRQEGVKPCRMVPSMRDEVHVRLHDVTGEVQQARLIVAVQKCTMCELLRWTRM